MATKFRKIIGTIWVCDNSIRMIRRFMKLYK